MLALGNRRLLGILVLVLMAGLLHVPSASADTAQEKKQKLDQQLEDLRDALEGTNDALVDAAVSLKKAQTQLVDARAALADASLKADRARKRDAELAQQVTYAEAAEQKAGDDLDRSQAAETATRATIGRIARATYLTSGLNGGLAIALNATSPEDFTDRLSVAGTALRAQGSAISRLQTQEAENRATAARLQAAKDHVDALKAESEKVVAEKAAAEKAAAGATAEVSALVQRESAAVAVINTRKKAEQDRVDELERESAALAALLAGRAKGHGATGKVGSINGSGALSYPVNGPITSGFGRRFHPILHYWRLHAGTDFGVACGTPVRAAAAGVVVRAGWAGGYGNQIVLDNGTIKGIGIGTSYNHLSKFVVTHGAVQRGQIIAYSGTTGASTGCHLHFEVYENGVHVNPMGWL